jgi:hypothetical protein
MVDKHRKKLEKLVKEEVTTLFESVLDYTQIACSDPNTFKALRSKILRVGNDCIRNINSNLNNYDVKFVATNEDVIEVCNKN